MADFTFKPIRDINVGDKVMVEGGKIKTVMKRVDGITDRYLVKQPYGEDYIVTKIKRLVFNRNMNNSRNNSKTNSTCDTPLSNKTFEFQDNDEDIEKQLSAWDSGFVGTIKHTGLGLLDTAALGIPHYIANKIGLGDKWGEPQGGFPKIGEKAGSLFGFILGGPMKLGTKAAAKALPYVTKAVAPLALKGAKATKIAPYLFSGAQGAVRSAVAAASTTTTTTTILPSESTIPPTLPSESKEHPMFYPLQPPLQSLPPPTSLLEFHNNYTMGLQQGSEQHYPCQEQEQPQTQPSPVAAADPH
jgi:hypothetical protein